jgi:phospholipid transport system substrate-binding protein
MDQGAPAKVLWRVREKNGNYKIVDIVIEGVSLAQASRSEYTSFIKNNPGGLDALIKDLNNKLKQQQAK